jgi:RNA polymerase sigma-70 factor (ECF subfamily)
VNTSTDDPAVIRFRAVFSHLAQVTAYARRRGSRDPEGIAAEAMTIAWRRLADVPDDDPRPWLYATARNLIHAEWRAAARTQARVLAERADSPRIETLDPSVSAALAALGPIDREALLLVAWEDLSPKLAADALGITAGAFRVRFHRARRRFRRALEEASSTADAGEPRMERA